MSTLRVEALEQPDGTAFVFNNKNLLINGGMNVWQRSTSTASITTSAYHTVDRWETSITTLGTWTQTRSTDVPSAQGFGYSLKMDCTTADASPAAGDYLLLMQKMEGQNLQHLLKGTSSAKKLTISFWVKSNKTGTYICEIDDNDNTRNINKSYTINSADTWEKKTITYDGDTSGVLDNDNDHSLRVMFWLGAGSDFTSGTLQTSWGSTVNANRAVGQVNLADSTSNEWYVTGIQLEVGSTASGFEFESYSVTENKCLRYFEQNSLNMSGMFVGGSAELPYVTYDYPTPKRTTVTATYVSGGVVRDRQTEHNISSLYSGLPVLGQSVTSIGLIYSLSSGAGVIGEACIVRNVTMKFDAEL